MENAPDLSQLLKLAQSPAGQQLLAALRQSGGEALESAVAQAAGGQYEEARKLLGALLAAPEAQALLKQLEENP